MNPRKKRGSESIHLRRYREEDHDQVWELHNFVLNAIGAHGGNGPWDDDLHHVGRVYLENGGEFVVVERDGRIVGMGALLRQDDRKAAVKRMRVHPDHQRKGIGQKILSHLEAKAVELGYTTLVLDTTVGQTAARRFYEKNGYREHGRTRYRQFHVILYEKVLVIPEDDGV